MGKPSSRICIVCLKRQCRRCHRVDGWYLSPDSAGTCGFCGEPSPKLWRCDCNLEKCKHCGCAMESHDTHISAVAGRKTQITRCYRYECLSSDLRLACTQSQHMEVATGESPNSKV